MTTFAANRTWVIITIDRL